MNSKYKHIGVFTSGGDSPGMNACVRAVVRTAIYHDVKITGIMRGYQGMVEGDFVSMNARSVSNIIHRGGTILKSARSKDFMDKTGREKAYRNISSQGIEAIVAIGGDGTFRGATAFTDEFGIPFIGIPGTIDNDLFGTDYTLGFDTAVNTAVEAIDKIRDTAASHDRLFFVEVMGRDAGYIALWSGIAGGAEAILLPEEKTDVDKLIELLKKGEEHLKTSSIVIVCEGDDAGGALEIAKLVKAKQPSFDTRVTVLGHVQRGGSPSAFDRILGSRLGVAATEELLKGVHGKMAGILNNKLTFTDFTKATKQHAPMDKEMLRYSKILAI
ncbi:MAG TPA: 6-phosphofructokinase [Bacteroidia bacterium]|mgnify:CR=1 FL=1|nr:6-phosphofructokinase [Bacteroidia bacterium]